LLVEPLGSETIVDLALGPDTLKARVPPTEHFDEQQNVWLTFDLTKLHILDIVTEMRLYSTNSTQLQIISPN
jgi:ABC-type sugar transport system ATPase subunit